MPVRNIEGGGGSDRLSVEEEAVAVGEKVAALVCEKAATAAKFADAEGRVYCCGGTSSSG